MELLEIYYKYIYFFLLQIFICTCRKTFLISADGKVNIKTRNISSMSKDSSQQYLIPLHSVTMVR